MPTDFWGNAIFSLVPTIALGLVFWFVIRAIIRADRNERKVYSEMEAEERTRRAAARDTSSTL
jgi:preprotein translocase subunit YajC